MRLIAGLVLMLLVLSWVACEAPLSYSEGSAETAGGLCALHAQKLFPSEPGPKTAWRRTIDGWEKTTWWSSDPPIRRPALHPTVVALMQMFLALGALILFAGAGSRRSGPK